MTASVDRLLAVARTSPDADGAAFALTCAENELAEAYNEARRDTLAQLATAAAAELETLESIRRLLAFAKTSGRATRETTRLLNLLETCPQFDRTYALKRQVPAFEWLRTHRDAINQNLAAIR